MNGLCTQFRGHKMRNHILYLTPLIAAEISDKEGAAVDIVFCPPLIYASNPKKPKISFSLHRVMRTYIIAWCNPFGYQSTQSSFFSQNDQNAPGKPWVDQKSNKVKILTKTTFSMVLFQTRALRILLATLTKFDQVWPRVDSRWAPETLTLIRSSNSNSNDYSWVKIGVKTVEILKKPWKTHQHTSRGHNFWSNHWNFNFFSFLKTRHPKLSKNTKIASIQFQENLQMHVQIQNWKSA